MDEASLVRMLLVLALIVGLILAFGWAARRTGLAGRGTAGAMRVVDSLNLGPRQRIVMVEVGGTCLVVGVAAGQMNLLHSLPAGDAARPQPEPPGSFAGRLGQALRRR
jgi:flagellar protein FliO/FliZ